MDQKLKEAIKKAQEVVAQLKIEDSELRKVAFEKAIDYFLVSQNEKELPKPPVGKGVKDGTTEEPQDFWPPLNVAAGIEIPKLKDIYSIKKDNQVLLVIPTVPGKTKADKQRNLAALILFAYHEGLNYELVPADLLAEAAKNSNLYDTYGFAKNMRFAWFRPEGKKKGRKYKLSSPGVSAAKELLGEVTEA